MTLHIVLVEPEIPPNTGNIARTCAATGVALHLVKPLGFSIDDKQVKRAGLDYWKFVDLHIYENLEEFLQIHKEKRKFLATTKGGRVYSDIQYKDEDMILLGKETKGLPENLINEHKEMAIRIPMSQDTRLRSLNLSNCANIIIFEALKQVGFPGLK
ncbi:MAG: tRNA (uridine(34)/cytosine(34)/5-carboxymethylaminomethyluridine(34)-2'-O)-methyltransferase TrmL [Anaerovoracaceae bacterium]